MKHKKTEQFLAFLKTFPFRIQAVFYDISLNEVIQSRSTDLKLLFEKETILPRLNYY